MSRNEQVYSYNAADFHTQLEYAFGRIATRHDSYGSKAIIKQFISSKYSHPCYIQHFLVQLF